MKIDKETLKEEIKRRKKLIHRGVIVRKGERDGDTDIQE